MKSIRAIFPVQIYLPIFQLWFDFFNDKSRVLDLQIIDLKGKMLPQKTTKFQIWIYVKSLKIIYGRCWKKNLKVLPLQNIPNYG